MLLPTIISSGPATRSGRSVHDVLASDGWVLVHQGKVRNTYEHAGHPNEMLVVATDRISIFDHILPTTIPRKGEVLTALTHFWLSNVLSDVENHLLDLFPSDAEFPRERALLVRKVSIQPFELIFRAHIGGSVWKSYVDSGTVSGRALPAGLKKWQRLEEPLFTPSTKAEEGHDVNISNAEYFEAMGEVGREAVAKLVSAYGRAYEFAKQRGILILDTKFEVGNPFVLADEVLTPDSSRFTSVADYDLAMIEGRDPIFYDKEPIRQWGRTVQTPFLDGKGNPVIGLNNLDPADPHHRDYIHNTLVTQIPEEVILDAAERYQRIFEMIVGMPLDAYQQTRMGVAR